MTERLPAMTPNWIGFPILALLLYNASVYLGTVMVQYRVEPVSMTIHEILAYFSVLLLSSLVLSPVLRRLEGRRGGSDQPGDMRYFILPAVLAIAVTAVRSVGIEQWDQSLAWKCILIGAQGATLPLVFALFFLSVPHDKSGFWFGVGISVGMLAVLLGGVGIDLESTPQERMARVNLLFHVRTALLALLSAATLLALAAWRNYGGAAVAAGSAVPHRGRKIALLAAAAALFFVLNGFLQGRLMPFIFENIGQRFKEVPLTLLAACPLVGLYCDRRPHDGNRRALRACAVLFIIAPALPVLTSTPMVFRVVYILTVAAYFCASLCATRAFAVLAGKGPLFCLLIASVHILILLSIAGRWVLREMAALEPSLILLVGIVTAMFLYYLLGKVDLDATALSGNAAEDIFSRNGLSPREREVALMLVKGASTRAIAEELDISENTVSTHVKSILRKFNVPTQKAFLAAIIESSLDGKKKS